MATVELKSHNTVKVAIGEIVRLVTPYAGPYYYNILNLGPGDLYLRYDDDPAPDDPESETLPAGCADNLVVIPEGREGLRVAAALGTTSAMSIRLVRG